MAQFPPSLDDVAVSFDFDGVLARSPFGHGVLFPVLKDLACAVSHRTGSSGEQTERHVRELVWEEFRGRTARGDYVQAYDWQAIVEAVARAMGERFEGSLAQRTREYALGLARSGDRAMVYPHAHDVLRNLKRRGACLLLLTNGFRDYQLPMTRAFGLEEYFDAIMAADDLCAVKPFPEAFERAFRACAHASPARRYHVGDTLSHDVLGARTSGIFAVWIDWDLPQDLARLEPLERSRDARLMDVLRAKLTQEEKVHGVAGLEVPHADMVRPDAVIVSLQELEAVIDGTPG